MNGQELAVHLRRLLVALASVIGLYAVFSLRNLIWSFDPLEVASDEDFVVIIYRVLFTAVVLVSITGVVLRTYPFAPREPVSLWRSAALGFFVGAAGIFLQWSIALFAAEHGVLDGAGNDYALFRIVLEGERPFDMLLILVAVGIVMPLAEELMFRGLVHRAFAAVLPRNHAVLISSALFAYFHASDMQVLIAFVVGFFAAVFYERTGRLLPGILLHVGINVGFVVLLYGGVRGIGVIPLAAPFVLFLGTAACAAAVFFNMPRREEVADLSIRVTIPRSLPSDPPKGTRGENSSRPDEPHRG
ncbi:MAG: CPBP family intramembrane metalloprotease [Planctomycetes bacterium]|nr:CPBP family intramembrane metalloprotease [Planctomycetota bacterium]